MRLHLSIAITLVATLVACTDNADIVGADAAPAAQRDDANATRGIDIGVDDEPNDVVSTKDDDGADGSDGVDGADGPDDNGDDPKNGTFVNPPDDKDVVSVGGDDDSASTTSVKGGDDQGKSDGGVSVDDDNVTLQRQTCVVEQYYQWQPLTIMIGSTGGVYPASAVLKFPKDAINFEIQIIGYSVDDHSPKVSVNGTQVININESARKSYNYLYPSGAGVSLKNVLVAGDNKFDLQATDAYGTHAGLGLCFSGTYQAVTCGSIIDRGVAPAGTTVAGPRGGTTVTRGCGQK